MQPITSYIQKVIETHNSGHAREHSYRPALKELFEGISALKVINEPKRSEHGAPDFVFLKGKIVVAYAEAKDINVSLAEVEKGEQMERYYGYSNIILTNGLEFRFYRNASSVCEPVTVGELHNGTITTHENKFQLLADTISDFIKDSKEPIKSGSVLSKVMAGKARRLRDNIKEFLTHADSPKNKNLLEVYEVIKKLLLSDLDTNRFADMYAQTLVYGLFVARYHDTSTDSFSRAEARDLVPSSNPFLRHFFDHIAGPSFDSRLDFIVNELCEEFTHADVRAIVHNYYKVDKDDSRDPIIHFYEDFLQEYDSGERKKMGVFYTPLPVVRFIVRAVDDILKTEFGLEKGLTDSSQIPIEIKVQDQKAKKDYVHRVQVLDPATGTGTFLNEIILHIKKSFEGQEGRWNSYVNNDLLPRLHGFELMMASYTIAHLKLATTIVETGAKVEGTRLGVYLTNSLEQSEKMPERLFDIGLGKAITEESNQAHKIKNDLPIMVVIGNPPYSGSSQNKNYSENSAYKVEPGGLIKLQERKNWLDDDYVKFIRLAESLIEKNGEGVVAMITSHGYVENPTFRGMRWHLRNTFDAIYVIDLHGNSNKKETSPDGSKDENVFNIKTGVSIMLGVKKRSEKKKTLAQVYKTDIYGTRKNKFDVLNTTAIKDISWLKLPADNDVWCVEGAGKDEYKKGFSVAEILPKNSTGIFTLGDGFIINENKEILAHRVDEFISNDISEIELKNKYGLGKNYGKWILSNKNKIENDHVKIVPIAYRPFDMQYTYFDNNLVWRPRMEVMKHFINKENLSFIFSRQGGAANPDYYDTVSVSKGLVDLNYYRRGGEIVCPLYLYHEDGTKVPNLKKEIVADIEKVVGNTTPEHILDYVYAVLHSPSYREKYKEFLKIDFPRVPYPTDSKAFWKLVDLGSELRVLHLLESPLVTKFITTFPESGSDTIEIKPKYKDGNVYVNETQHFGNVPEVAWNFYIGGYQPAQKWLKDRVDRKLTSDDIEHYQKMIVALSETARVMVEVDKVFIC